MLAILRRESSIHARTLRCCRRCRSGAIQRYATPVCAPPRVCPFRNVLLSERKHRSQFCGLPFFFLYMMQKCLSSTKLASFFQNSHVFFSPFTMLTTKCFLWSDCNKTIIIFLVLWFRVCSSAIVTYAHAHCTSVKLTHDERRTRARDCPTPAPVLRKFDDLPAALLVFGSSSSVAMCGCLLVKLFTNCYNGWGWPIFAVVFRAYASGSKSKIIIVNVTVVGVMFRDRGQVRGELVGRTQHLHRTGRELPDQSLFVRHLVLI